MTTLRNLLMAICAVVILIEGFANDYFPIEWNRALLIVAGASLCGVVAIAYALRNEVTK